MSGERGISMELAEMFADIARTLLAEDEVNGTLDKMCSLAVETIDGCEHAGLSLVERRKVIAAAVSDPVPRRIDEIQSEVDEGPCLDAIKEHEVFETGCLSQEDRWPEFSTRAHEETRIESVLSFRLFAEKDTMGALNLYSTLVDAFDDDAVAVGSVFAAHAAVAMSTSRRIEKLQHAVDGRDIIGQAKGILRSRQPLSNDEAFDMLRRASQRTNVKLRDVAADIVERATDDPPD